MFILQGGHAALVGALRREEAASRSIKRLEGELEGVRDVLRQRDMDAQRTKMIIRLKEDKIARLQARLLFGSAIIEPSATCSARLDGSQWQPCHIAAHHDTVCQGLLYKHSAWLSGSIRTRNTSGYLRVRDVCWCMPGQKSLRRMMFAGL